MTKNINMGVGSKAKKRRVPLKETSAAEIDDLLSTNEPSPEIISAAQTDISDELIDDIGASQDEGVILEEELLSRLDNEDFEESQPFNSDISSSIPEKVLEKIAAYLEEVTSEDIKSRQPWLDIINKTKPFLGFGLEEASNKINATINSSTVNNDQIKTFDTTFSTALLRLWALLRSELLPSAGPCGFKTDSNNTEAFELQGEITKDALNEYLTIEDKGFYPDYDRFLLYLLLYGCVFRKVYYDSITKKPISRFIIPEDFLVDNNCSSILESNRLTHIRYLSKREILLNMQDGTFRSVELDYLKSTNNIVDTEENDLKEDDVNSGIDISAYSTLSRFKFYETHEYLDLNEFFDSGDTWESGSNFLPSPYVITRCGLSNKIVSIIPNWQEDDPTRTRINCFVHYNLFPGFDIYGLGLAQVLGSNAMSLTCMQRMAIDAAIFQNFPGGVKVPGIKNQNNDITITPGQFITLDTGALPLAQAIMPLPYNGPSPALLEYLQRVTNQTQQLASTSEVGMPENSANTPVGTTMAMLEVANRMQSAILRTVHASFSDEIQLLFQTLNPMDTGFTQSDDNFAEHQPLKIIPVSDPSVESTTQRIMKAESLLKIASTDPQLHNMREIYTRVYQALGISGIDQILLPQEEQMSPEQAPVDPQVQVQMADIEQRRLEVESRERIAHLNIEADGYKTQMNIELDKAKMEQDRYIADLKVNLEELLNQTKLDMDML
ncbi:portal protein, partial [Candidatus Bandiella numerosa]|uniref:portal protein n=1 Tax=Candidatus Bandiella numerosa TaxID=2570586 RepID=UPI001F1DB3E3